MAALCLAVLLATPGWAGETAQDAAMVEDDPAVAAAAQAGDASRDVALAKLMTIEGDVAWGAYLGSECTACHGEAGGRIPPIAGLPREHMLSALLDYRSGSRENATMEQVAKGLGDDEMAALAAYFESVE